ncbi:hypothetical protein JOC78_001569 [Bacillus ectoiniformans]|uniref:hypothetical protein n=1 Tax=Bacillus ectoiniformans TaxID=1494429 RepID=UPI00195CBB76|nr:hypothetical protein [Bacillus ectoiniformans]MBM7648623.1 hypothetical protein [Bacillus ectoiniformans]
MKARIKLKNTTQNQEIARKLKEANKKNEYPVDISFSKDLTEIFFEGECIWIPKKEWFDESMLLEGYANEKESGYEIKPRDKGKTVNLHLDAELVAELNEIKNHVISKTQHDILLELFKKGLDQYNKENKS